MSQEEVHILRQKMGVEKGALKGMLGIWKNRGYIELYGMEMPKSELHRQRYAKTEKYLWKRKTEGCD